MFYGKRIQQLEERVDALEKRVHELAHKMRRACNLFKPKLI